jgi:hypothetical protein
MSTPLSQCNPEKVGHLQAIMAEVASLAGLIEDETLSGEVSATVDEITERTITALGLPDDIDWAA